MLIVVQYIKLRKVFYFCFFIKFKINIFIYLVKAFVVEKVSKVLALIPKY